MPIEERMMFYAERGEIVPSRGQLKTLQQIGKECVNLRLADVPFFADISVTSQMSLTLMRKPTDILLSKRLVVTVLGVEFHEDPFVSYVTPKGSEMLLVPSMMFTIEPMIYEGSPDFYVDEDNGWTVYTIGGDFRAD